MCFKPMMDLAFPVFFSCNTKWIEKMFWTFWMTKNHRVVYLVDLNVFELSMFTGAVRSTSFQSQRSKLRGSRSMPPFQNELRCWRTGCITPWHRGLKIGIHFFLFFSVDLEVFETFISSVSNGWADKARAGAQTRRKILYRSVWFGYQEFGTAWLKYEIGPVESWNPWSYVIDPWGSWIIIQFICLVPRCVKHVGKTA